MTDWKFADIYEAIAAAIPAAVPGDGDRVTTWGEFDRRANAFAADLIDAGLTHQSKMAAYLYNGVEYLETYIGAFKGGFAPVNTNYRYGPEEIVYLFDNADAEAVVFHASFTPLLEGIRSRLSKVRRWYVVSDETGDGPDWAVACVLFEVRATITVQAQMGYGYCERMQWQNGRWMIAPGASPARAPSTWPGSELSIRAGWRTWVDAAEG